MFSPALVAILLGTGAVIGFLSGLIGIGGGSFMIPALVLTFGAAGVSPDLSVKMAFGTNLVVGSLTALTGFTVHRRHLSQQWSVVLPLSAASVLGALAGSTVASHLPGRLLRVLFGVAVMVVAGNMLARREGEKRSLPRLSVAKLVPLGLAIGFAASLVGLGGAVFTTIILVNLLQYPMRQVVGISTFVQTAGALSGAIGYVANGLGRPDLPRFSLGYVNLLAAGAMMVTGVPLARLGALCTHRVDPNSLRRIFAGALVLIAFFMITGAGGR